MDPQWILDSVICGSKSLEFIMENGIQCTHLIYSSTIPAKISELRAGKVVQ
jgi:hypothetical protein